MRCGECSEPSEAKVNKKTEGGRDFRGAVRGLVRQVSPPVLLAVVRKGRAMLRARETVQVSAGAEVPGEQSLGIYWDAEMAAALETWGADSTWQEVQLIFSGLRGRVLDIACGTGVVMEILGKFPEVEVSGCDISDYLLAKGVERGLAAERMTCCDATKLPYGDGDFDYGYSIGSLEHFTDEGITGFLREARRVTRAASFHMIPVSKSGQDEGWMSPLQSYFNNSEGWWVKRAEAVFSRVVVVRSGWSDKWSEGIWMLCYN